MGNPEVPVQPPVHVVLINPEIPPNTGNIGRLCCATGSRLHLVRPLGFALDDKQLKRAGLDYWQHVDVNVWPGLEDFLDSVDHDRLVLTSSKRGREYHRIAYRPGDYLLFGPETTGLACSMFDHLPSRVARIPIFTDRVRSLNLATSVGIMVYEVLRQTNELPGDDGGLEI